MTEVLVAEQLTAGYGRRNTVVRDVDLKVSPGEVVVLLGPNGAGKTTTLLTLAGELPLQGGQVALFGRPTKAPLHHRAREGLGLVTEERTVLTRLTVRENFRVGRCDLDDAMHLFPELEEHLDRRVGLLSGGQQQMLSLARALARAPRLLLADELSLGLAPQVVDRLLRAVRDAADRGVAVLLVEQHLQKALQVADRGYVMRRGRVELDGTASELRAQMAAVQSSYLALESRTTQQR